MERKEYKCFRAFAGWWKEWPTHLTFCFPDKPSFTSGIGMHTGMDFIPQSNPDPNDPDQENGS